MENLLTAKLPNVIAKLPHLTAQRPAPTTPLPRATPRARTLLWVARGLTGLVAASLLADATAKLLALGPVVEGTRQLGFSVGVIRPLGLVLAVSTLLHLLPRTQLVGALLLTAYLGGATATLVRAGTPFWFPVAMGAILWIAYFLRSPRLRSLLLPLPLQLPNQAH